MPASILIILTALVIAAPPGPTIVDVAIQINGEGDFAGQFDTLIAASGEANPLVLETLSGNGQFTVFAPTDEAFADLDLDPNNIEQLDKDFLTDVLLYHVARARRYEKSVLKSKRIRMLKGGFLLQDQGILTDNLGGEANIIVTDVEKRLME